MSIPNSYCYWCLCRHCTKFKCPRRYVCTDCKYKRRKLDCDFFENKKIVKRYRLRRKKDNFTKNDSVRFMRLFKNFIDDIIKGD